MSDDRVLRTLRMQAWKRAKGELDAVLATYWDEEETYKKMRKAVYDFIAHVEEEGLES